MFGASQNANNPDGGLQPVQGTCHATINTWSALMVADSARMGASVQNIGTGVMEIACDALADGAAVTGTGAAATRVVSIAAGGRFDFPWYPRRKYYIRSTVTVDPYILNKW